jgi:hypothetical protein
LPRGLPGYAHLAGREAALSALREKRRNVIEPDYSEAISESVSLIVRGVLRKGETG